jgi:hypothetical protein
MLDLGLRKGDFDGKEDLHAGADHQQTEGS